MQKRKIDELISHFNRKVADMDIDREYKMELLGMITAIGIACEKELSIEPERKTGKWIERNPQNSDKCRLIKCDQCGFAHIVGFNVPYEHWIENRNFCERCGADMRKKGEK